MQVDADADVDVQQPKPRNPTEEEHVSDDNVVEEATLAQFLALNIDVVTADGDALHRAPLWALGLNTLMDVMEVAHACSLPPVCPLCAAVNEQDRRSRHTLCLDIDDLVAMKVLEQLPPQYGKVNNFGVDADLLPLLTKGRQMTTASVFFIIDEFFQFVEGHNLGGQVTVRQVFEAGAHVKAADIPDTPAKGRCAPRRGYQKFPAPPPEKKTRCGVSGPYRGPVSARIRMAVSGRIRPYQAVSGKYSKKSG
jgi:hypothetical protein